MFLRREASGTDDEAIQAALAKPHDREILALAQSEPVSAQDIQERTRIPESTVYRRINELEERGLIEVEDTVLEDGHRIERYRCVFEALELRIEGGEVSVDWILRDEDGQAADRLRVEG